MLSYLFIAALWSPAWKGLASWLSYLYVMFSCVFVTFPCGVLGQVRYLIESIHDLCFLTYVNAIDTIIICGGLISTHKSFTIHLQKQLFSRGKMSTS